MWRLFATAALVLGAMPGHGAVIAVVEDVAQLRAFAAGCAELRGPDGALAGRTECTEYRDEAGGAVFGGGLRAEAGAAGPGFPWSATAEPKVRGGAVDAALFATTGPATGLPSCGLDGCRVIDARAGAALAWRLVFGVTGGDASLRVAQSGPGEAPYTLTLLDLSTGLEPSGDGAVWRLQDGGRYRLTFDQFRAGSPCTRTCASLTSLVFGDVEFRGAVDGAGPVRVPEPASGALLVLGLLAGAALRRSVLRRSPTATSTPRARVVTFHGGVHSRLAGAARRR